MRWRDVYWRLYHGDGRHLLPAEVDALTIGELEVLLDSPDPSGKRRLPEGFVAMSPEQQVLWARARRAMPLADRIRRAREG